MRHTRFYAPTLNIVLIERHFRSRRKKKAKKLYDTRTFFCFSLLFNKRETKTCLELFSQLFLRQLRLIVSLVGIWKKFMTHVSCYFINELSRRCNMYINELIRRDDFSRLARTRNSRLSRKTKFMEYIRVYRSIIDIITSSYERWMNRGNSFYIGLSMSEVGIFTHKKMGQNLAQFFNIFQ